MIKVIVGPKGSGKTSKMVQDLNAHADNDLNNVVCIERGKRLNGLISYKIRLVDIDEYPTLGFRELGSFVAGLLAKDYDITHIYIDSVYKVAGSRSEDELIEFLNYLEPFTNERGVILETSLSDDPQNLKPELAKYVIAHEQVS